jgi:hypothetical protein
MEAAGIEPSQELSGNSPLLVGNGAESGALPASRSQLEPDLIALTAFVMALPATKRQAFLEQLLGALPVSCNGPQGQIGNHSPEGGIE